MAAPYFQTVLDRLFVNFNGGVRVRVYLDGGARETFICGASPKIPGDRLTKIILELSPEGIGTVDVKRDGNHWKLRARGTIAEDGFEQRLRNVLVNS